MFALLYDLRPSVERGIRFYLNIVELNSIYERPVSPIEGNCENRKDSQQYAECKGIEQVDTGTKAVVVWSIFDVKVCTKGQLKTGLHNCPENCVPQN